VIPIRDTVPSRGVPIVSWSIIGINVAVFLFELSLDDGDLEQLFRVFGIVPADAHPVAFITCMFLHGSWLHLIGNMWSLWIFGDNVEERMGRLRFLAFYLLTGIAAGLTHSLTNPLSTMPTVGASGAIAGVLGAYYLLFPTARVIAMVPIFFFPFFFELPAVLYLGFWLLSQVFGATLSMLVPTGDAGGIAWWAHVGGFGAGVVLHRFFLLPQASRRRRFQPDEAGIEGAWSGWR
jgi:membrane associated rhomboid family serine protease